MIDLLLGIIGSAAIVLGVFFALTALFDWQGW